MFDLKRDLDQYKGVPPYAAEMYGVYQPLLGWRSRLTQKWAQQGRSGADPRIKKILDQHINPPPMAWQPEEAISLESRLHPVEAGNGRAARVRVRNVFNSRVVDLAVGHVQGFFDEHERLPQDGEWAALFPIERYIADEGSDIRLVEQMIRVEVMVRPMGTSPVSFDLEGAAEMVKRLVEYETQVATWVFWAAHDQGELTTADLAKLFFVEPRAPLASAADASDPLADIDPRDNGGVLATVGFITLFRQFFFDLGSFLGEPVQHVWLAPGTTTELVETRSLRSVVESLTEQSFETMSRSEREARVSDELSQAVRAENESSTKLGISTTHTVTFGVYEGTATGSFDLDTARRDSRETTHRTTREQGEKHVSEIKRSARTSLKRTTETTDTSSRRHVIVNATDKLLNYELRRKMRRVGVQLQDVGQRLCWQVFVDDPGAALGLAELVHFASTPELDKLPDPEKLPPPDTKPVKTTLQLPYKPVLNYTNNRAHYEFQGPAPNGVLLGIIKGDEDDDDSQIVIEFLRNRVAPPETGYVFNGRVVHLGTQGNKLATVREIRHNATDQTFDVILQRVCFAGDTSVTLDVEVFFDPTEPERKRVNDANAEADKRWDAERDRLLRKAYMESVRDRIKDASGITRRPAWDLREEERTIVYRKLVERLMLDSWKLPDTQENRRLSHVRAEIIRTLFDIDSMLYFVAPEWWMPRRRTGRITPEISIAGEVNTLGSGDTVMWGTEKRPDNYLITEESTPAPLGSSLGWLMQLDGDNRRNAFLNAPWVKAVIPVRPGRERAALNWLRALEGHEHDGWDDFYIGKGTTEAQYNGMRVGEVLDAMAAELEKANEDVEMTLKADEVFETGFSHLAKAFDASIAPNRPFSQWISILPTDQIVAAEYKPVELFEP